MRKNALLLLLICSGGLALAGCASTKPNIQSSQVISEPVPETVRFGSPMSVVSDSYDSSDPSDLVRFAIKLFEEKGRYDQAAEFFLEASEFDSERDEFRHSCLAAAAESLLLTGDVERFVDVVQDLKSNMSSMQLADVDPDIELLMSIADRMEGRNPRNIPSEIRELFSE